MDYKLMALDIDGTLVSSNHQLLPETQHALIEAQTQGLKLVLASGRPTPGMMKLAEALELEKFGGFVLSYNGGRITNMQTKEVIHEVFLTPEEAHEIYDFAKENNVNMMAYDEADIITEDDDDYIQIESTINAMPLKRTDDFKKAVVNKTIKVLTTGSPEIIVEVEKAYIEKFEDRFSICRSMPFFLEVMPQGINKAASLGKLLATLDLTPDEMIACGDGFNDIEMVKYAGLGVAMENAVDEVKAVANYVTKSNDDDGIAHVIKKFVLK
ncbi:MAG: Cof-type HAD-IIB family hydrolase [Defluviitaleaceae bacterium]|nr:Cof-type HAD-IIB family hydrolase [Defluviitaleaceae bacterium]